MDALCIILACIVFDGQWWIVVVWPVTWCHAAIKGIEQSHRWFWMEICGGSFEDVPIDLAQGAQWPFGTWRVSLQWGEAWLLKSEADLKDQPDFDGLFQKPACSIRSPLGAHCMPTMHNNAGEHADLNAYIVRCLFVWVMSLRMEYDLSSPWHVWSHKSNMEFPMIWVPPIIQSSWMTISVLKPMVTGSPFMDAMDTT